MSNFEIIPAIDLRGGRCVRLLQGDYARETVFGDDPVQMARHWAALGATRLHVVDLDGAKEGKPVQLSLVGAITGAIQIPVELGGGLRSERDIDAAFGAGVDRVVLGTAAIAGSDKSNGAADRQRYLQRYGDRVIVGLDARNGKLAVRGWLTTTDLDAFEFAQSLRDEGFGRIIYTDISRDGALAGPNVKSIHRLAAIPGLAIIASGGVSSIEDLTSLERAGAEAAIVGQAIYTGALDLEEAIRQLAKSGPQV